MECSLVCFRRVLGGDEMAGGGVARKEKGEMAELGLDALRGSAKWSGTAGAS